MAIDWTKIEGYKDDMTAEEKLQLLENLPEQEEDKQGEDENRKAPPLPDPKNYISKARYDQVASELAAAKKELKSRLSEDEQKELERQTKANEMETELNELRREKKLASYKASYLAQGYDEQMAENAAVAMVDGDTDTIFAIMKQYSTVMEKEIKSKLLKDTPRPPAGDTPPTEDEKNKKYLNTMRQAAGLPPLK